jgi:hypothetical protein
MHSRADGMDELEVARFECRDAEGNLYVVVEIQELSWTQTKTGRLKRQKSSRRLQLLDGPFVNCLDSTTFEIARSGKTIVRAD